MRCSNPTEQDFGDHSSPITATIEPREDVVRMTNATRTAYASKR